MWLEECQHVIQVIPPRTIQTLKKNLLGGMPTCANTTGPGTDLDHAWHSCTRCQGAAVDGWIQQPQAIYATLEEWWHQHESTSYGKKGHVFCSWP